MIEIESSVVIGKSMEKVFAIVGDPLRDPKWHFDVHRAQLLHGSAGDRVRRGTKYRWYLECLGEGREEAIVEVKLYEPARKVDLVVVAGSMVQGIGYRLQPLDNSNTYITRVTILCHANMSSSAQEVMRPLLQNRTAQYLSQLRQLLEGGPLDPFVGRSPDPAVEPGPLHSP